jgi:ribosomal protein L11 methyltransferase
MAELHGLEISVPPAQAELLSAALSLRVSHGWEEAEHTDSLLARVYTPSPSFAQNLEEELRALYPSWVLSRLTLPDTDWVSAWKQFFTPVRAGRRFLVLPPWLAQAGTLPRLGQRLPIIIEPKTAFGTGHHATTALCLRALSDLSDAGLIRAGQSFLDLGTGSGILGIGAARLGLKGLGLDIDPVAVENALENRVLNRTPPESLEFRQDCLDTAPEENFDLLMANILAEPLLEMAEAITSKLKPGGLLILSGLLRSQSKDLLKAYTRLGFSLVRRLRQGEWAALLLRRDDSKRTL